MTEQRTTHIGACISELNEMYCKPQVHQLNEAWRLIVSPLDFNFTSLQYIHYFWGKFSEKGTKAKKFKTWEVYNFPLAINSSVACAYTIAFISLKRRMEKIKYKIYNIKDNNGEREQKSINKCNTLELIHEFNKLKIQFHWRHWINTIIKFFELRPTSEPVQ